MKSLVLAFAFVSASAFATTSKLVCNVAENGMGGTIYLQLEFMLNTPKSAGGTALGSQNQNGPWTVMCTTPMAMTVDARQNQTIFSGQFTCTDGSGAYETMVLDDGSMKLSTDFGSGRDSTLWDCQWM